MLAARRLPAGYVEQPALSLEVAMMTLGDGAVGAEM